MRTDKFHKMSAARKLVINLVGEGMCTRRYSFIEAQILTGVGSGVLVSENEVHKRQVSLVWD